MRIRVSIFFAFLALALSGQEEEKKPVDYIYINPFNAGINSIALTWEHRMNTKSLSITGGYIYQKTEAAINGFGFVPDNYIIMNTLYAYNGFLLYPGCNFYLKKNPESWFGVRALFKYMFYDSLDVPWQWQDAESLIRRVQSDDLFVTGAEFLYGIKTDFAKHFFYEIFMGVGFRVKFHSMRVYNSYIETDPSRHPDPSYPFDEKYKLFRPTIHLGINLGLKL
jgi:hypothetical protein